MKKGLAIGAVALIAVAAAGFGAMGFGKKAVEPAATTTPATLATPVANTAADLAPLGVYAGTTTASGGFTGDILEGSPDAPVTIIEYASLTCPHCAAFHEETYKPLKAQYIDTGKVKFIYRDFPLNDPAMAATLVARCGGEDKYLAFIDVLMTQQAQWTRSDDMRRELLALAKFGGLSLEKVDSCLSDQALGQNVVDRTRAASEVFKVNSTPTLIINGVNHKGGRDFESLSKFIDGLL